MYIAYRIVQLLDSGRIIIVTVGRTGFVALLFGFCGIEGAEGARGVPRGQSTEGRDVRLGGERGVGADKDEWRGSELEFNVPFQHKHGYIRDERRVGDSAQVIQA